MLYKSANTEVNEVKDEGIITAYVATFDLDPDCYGDVIAKGAFARTLKEWSEKASRIPVLFGHKQDDPLFNIGAVVDAKEDERGLLATMQIDMDSERGAYTYKLAKEGRISKLSFGYSVVDSGTLDIAGAKVNELKDIDLYEVSIVTIPANQHTEIIEVKDNTEVIHAQDEQEQQADANTEVEEQSEVVSSLIKRIDDILRK